MELLKSLLGGAGGAAFVSGLYGLLQWFLSRKAQKEDQSANALNAKCKKNETELSEIRNMVEVTILAQRTSMYDRIKHIAKSYISRGWVTVEELEDLNRMHEVYHDPDKLNGNGFLNELMHTVNTALEIRVK